MDSRQQFEDFAKANHVNLELSKYPDNYATFRFPRTQHMWEAWQASRESLVVTLPDPFWPGYVEEDEPGLYISTNLFTIEQITEALADQGITAR